MARPKNKTNSVIRLRDILIDAARVPSSNTDNQPKSCVKAWCEVFKIDDFEEGAFLQVIEQLIQLRMLFEEAENSLREIEGLDESLYIEPLDAMSRVVSDLTKLDRPWAEFVGVLSPENMRSLSFIEDRFSTEGRFNEEMISPDDLSKIQTEAMALYDQIKKSDLPKNVKTILLDLVLEIHKAIHEYRVRGARRLKEAIGKTIGVLATNQEILEPYRDSDQVKAVAGLVQKADDYYKVAKTVSSLYGAVTWALPLLGAGN